jgi:hypothetical protein
MPEPRSDYCIIELRIWPIPDIAYFGGHMFWVLKDSAGKVQQELHFWGAPGTDLTFRSPKYDWKTKHSIIEPMIRYSAPCAEIRERWAAGVNAGELLQARPHVDYPSIWDTIKAAAGDGSITNSNAGAYTIGKAMLPELVRKEKSTKIPTPGWGVDLFDYDYPGIPPQSPDDNQPDMDVRPDFRNETRNEENRRGVAPANPVQLASYRMTPSYDATVTPAMRALNAAKADDAFTKRYLNGDRDAVDHMHALHRAAYPEPSDQTMGPAVRPDAPDTSAGGYSLGTRDMTPAQQALGAAKSDNGFVKRYLDGDRTAFNQMQSLIQAAYPEPKASSDDGAGSGASVPIFQPWTPEAATEGLAPWMQNSLKDYLSSSPDDESDGYSKLAPWMRDAYPAWLRGNGG